MKPSYKLTTQNEGDSANLATKVRQVEAWLADLSTRDAAKNADLLAAYLDLHDHPDLPATFRKQLFDLLSPDIAGCLHGLEAGVQDSPLPLDARQAEYLGRAIRLLLAKANFNKRLILDYVDYAPRLFGTSPLPELIAGLLHTLGRVLDLSYTSHNQVPAGVWHDLHQTARLIFEKQLGDTPDPTDNGRTFAQIYTVMLLEAVADPYHCSDQDRLWIRDVIARLGVQASVEDAKKAGYKGVYGVRLEEDGPPRPLSWREQRGKDYGHHDLVLITTQLARSLAFAISRMERGKPAGFSLPVIRHPAYMALLKRLKLLWGGAMRRNSARRTPSRQVSYQVLLGFYPIHKYLTSPPEEETRFDTVQCQIVNESLGGVALSVETGGVQVQVGMLAFVGRDQNFQDLGVVRWFKTGSGGALTLGIRFVLGKPKPVTLYPEAGRHVYPALLLEQESGPARAAASLVMPSVRLDPNGKVDIRRGEERLLVRLEQKIEGSNDIDLFRCRIGGEDAIHDAGPHSRSTA